MARPATYLPTPADAPVVTITDHVTGETWQGVIHEGIVHDASGIVDPEDIGGRFTVDGGHPVSVIGTCPARHAGACDAVLSVATARETLAAHGVESRVSVDGEVEAWEPATVFPGNGRPAYDASTWVPVSRQVHALAAWLGY
jgi:hypothetical protein